MPNGKKPQGRRVWGIDLETVWIPTFTATNLEGDTAIPPQALGCPLRLAYDKDGSVRFSQAGKPIIRVAKELSDSVRLMRENFTATLINYYEEVQKQNPDGYAKLVKANHKAGEPIFSADRANLEKAQAERMEAEVAKLEAEGKPAEPATEPATEPSQKGKKELTGVTS